MKVQIRPQTKGAVTLTVAAVFLLTGLWGLWYEPISYYELRRSETIAGSEFILDPNAFAVKTFDGTAGQEIIISAYGNTISDTSYEDPPPILTIKVYDPKGKLIQVYGNITSLSNEERIAIKESGTFKIETANKQDETTRISMSVRDVTELPNKPFEALGQWLAIISLPVFGLGIWFAVCRPGQSKVTATMS